MKAAAVAVAGVTALAGAQMGTGAESASRIVDRTLLCKMTGVGYPDPARILRVGAATYDAVTSDIPSSISVSNGGEGSGTSVHVVAGGDDQPAKNILYNRRTTCSPSNLRVPLSRKLLAGGPVRFTSTYDCDVPARILVRVQGIFERPPRVTPDGVARGDIVRGYIAVATFPGRKPIAFSSINGTTGQTGISVSRALCKEDS